MRSMCDITFLQDLKQSQPNSWVGTSVVPTTHYNIANFSHPCIWHKLKKKLPMTKSLRPRNHKWNLRQFILISNTPQTPHALQTVTDRLWAMISVRYSYPVDSGSGTKSPVTMYNSPQILNYWYQKIAQTSINKSVKTHLELTCSFCCFCRLIDRSSWQASCCCQSFMLIAGPGCSTFSLGYE